MLLYARLLESATRLSRWCKVSVEWVDPIQPPVSGRLWSPRWWCWSLRRKCRDALLWTYFVVSCVVGYLIVCILSCQTVESATPFLIFLICCSIKQIWSWFFMLGHWRLACWACSRRLIRRSICVCVACGMCLFIVDVEDCSEDSFQVEPDLSVVMANQLHADAFHVAFDLL